MLEFKYSRASEFYNVPVPYRTQNLTVFCSNIHSANLTVKNTKIYRYSLEKRDPYRFKTFRYSYFKKLRAGRTLPKNWPFFRDSLESANCTGSSFSNDTVYYNEKWCVLKDGKVRAEFSKN